MVQSIYSSDVVKSMKTEETLLIIGRIAEFCLFISSIFRSIKVESYSGRGQTVVFYFFEVGL